MNTETEIVAYEGGALHLLASETSGREAVLALPLTHLLVKVVRVPAGADAVEVATPILKSISPFPDEALTVSCETVTTSEDGSTVLAAAFPEGVSENVAEALDAAHLNVVKVDALVFGALRRIWGDLKVDDGKRRLVILRSPDCLSLIVLDGDAPVSIRAIVDDTELKRETWLSLLDAEAFAGPKELAETIDREVSVNEALVGIRERAEEGDTLDALPESWREVLAEERFKKKLFVNLAIAGGIWLLIMAVLFGVPVVYDFMKGHMDGLSKAHAREYKAVKDMKEKTELFTLYSDRSLGALEIMKAVSDRLPLGITLSDWRYDSGAGEGAIGGVTVSGSAEDKSAIFLFKEQLEAMARGEGEDAERVFKSVRLGDIRSQGGVHRFSIECRYEEENE